WNGAADFSLIREGAFEELRGVGDLPQGIYRLSIDMPRLISKEVQHARSWLLFNQWNVDLFGPSTKGGYYNGPKYSALLKTAAAEHRSTSSLVLANEIEGPKGPHGSDESYALEATTTIELPAGRYRFSVTGDDGVLLYVDG